MTIIYDLHFFVANRPTASSTSSRIVSSSTDHTTSLLIILGRQPTLKLLSPAHPKSHPDNLPAIAICTQP